MRSKESFLKKVVKTETGCWIWFGDMKSTGKKMYGIVILYKGELPRVKRTGLSNKRTIPAHKFAYMLYHGTLPKGASLRHTCPNSLCVNPEHMQLIQKKPVGPKKVENNT